MFGNRVENKYLCKARKHAVNKSITTTQYLVGLPGHEFGFLPFELLVLIIAGDEKMGSRAEQTRTGNVIGCVGALLGMVGREERVVCDKIEPFFGHQFESEDGLDG
ncbi:hypothetical protein Sjap_017316 [Stephania japonica]|uniref:Uncharacterized protein n=1 Tax=Stephania japonica TaxID=461633 RepID=A0AAP0NLV2_9MAGN